MKNRMKFLFAVGALVFVPDIHALALAPQTISKIRIASNGNIEVYTSDHSGTWFASSCPYDAAVVIITPTQGPQSLWLSLLLMAKASGRTVKFDHNGCATTPNSFVVSDITIN